jgi:hypothetical protein
MKDSELAAVTYSTGGDNSPGGVFVVDVPKASVAATLKGTGWVEALAFSSVP